MDTARKRFTNSNHSSRATCDHYVFSNCHLCLPLRRYGHCSEDREKDKLRLCEKTEEINVGKML